MSYEDETRARRVPRGPKEWGKVLYEPEWVLQRRHRESYIVHTGYALVVFGVVLVLWSLAREGGDLDAFVLLGPWWLFIVFGALLPIAGYKTMPFRVYQAGFTKFVVPLSRGLRGEEVLVPREAIRRVEIDSTMVENRLHRRIKISYIVGSQEEDLTVPFEQTEDPMGVLVALGAMVPDAVDPGVLDFVGDEDPVVEMPGSVANAVAPYRYTLGLVAGMGVFLAVVLGSLMQASDPDSLTRLLLTVLTASSASALTLVLGNALAIQSIELMANADTRLVGDSIHMPEPFSNGLLLEVRPTVPLGEVVEVRRALDPMSMYHVGRVRLTNGETWNVPYQVFEGLSGRPGFEREGLALVNRGVGDVPGPPLAQVSMAKGVAWGVSLVLLTIGTTVVVTLHQGENPLAWLGSDEGIFFAQVVFGPLLQEGGEERHDGQGHDGHGTGDRHAQRPRAVAVRAQGGRQGLLRRGHLLGQPHPAGHRPRQTIPAPRGPRGVDQGRDGRRRPGRRPPEGQEGAATSSR